MSPAKAQTGQTEVLFAFLFFLLARLGFFILQKEADGSSWRGLYVDRGVLAIIDDNMDAFAIGN